MKRFYTTILAVLCFLGLGFSMPEVQAKAENKPDTLYLPDSYEEYLPLSDTRCVAENSDTTAIADGTRIFLYSKARAVYQCFTHTANVTELQFDNRGVLYFLDVNASLHTLDVNSMVDTDLNFSCASFTLAGDVLYYLTISGADATILSVDKNDLTATKTIEQNNLLSSPKPTLATYDNGNGVNLYFSCFGTVNTHLYCLQEQDNFELTLPVKNAVQSIAFFGGVLYYVESNNFYAYNIALLNQKDLENAKLFSAEGGFKSVSIAYDGNVYAVKNNSVLRYSPIERKFLDFEIASSSLSENRLNHATALYENAGTVYIADQERVSVVTDSSISVFPVDITAKYIAGDDKTLLIADETSLYLYDLETQQKMQVFGGYSGIVGIRNIYGNYCFVTKQNRYCTIVKSSDAFTVSEVQKPTATVPKLFTADVFGDLYVGYTDNTVRRFTEEEFLDMEQFGTLISDTLIPQDSESIYVDFHRNLYALQGNTLTLFSDAEKPTYTLHSEVVYSQTDDTPVVGVVLGVEENVAYVLYDGTFLVKTESLSLPSLNNIAVNGADESVFSETSASFSLIRIAPHTLVVPFDLNSLRDSTVFPYSGNYYRSNETLTALKLAETDDFTVVAVYDETAKTFRSALIETSKAEEIPETEYLKQASSYTDGIGYLTNDIALYKYPYITDLLTVDFLEKGTNVKVLGEIDELDYSYCYVEIEKDGTTVNGYIPKKYVLDFDGKDPKSNTAVVGETQSDTDSVYRLAFILLGLSAIAILTDYLILRNRNKE